ncbi:FAD-binding domain-containing protein [Mycena capillaripes]|nr:FAD-binding domain-containing protein [Mycena capillaripes]
MKSFAGSLALLFYSLFGHSREAASEDLTSKSPVCRNTPGDPRYPSAIAWSALNSTISGRLVSVVPSAKYCASLPAGACNDTQWESALFRGQIPGAMNQVNWEQGYDLKPPSLCLRNATTCGQGDVPIYCVEAETVADIQAALKFATTHNLRVAIKSSGHDYLGRSTARNSLLIRTSKFQNISFTDSFFVGSEDMGSAVTMGTGVYSNTVYEHGKANGKVALGGLAATICTAGGYVQGGGHSPLSPTFGLASDNALEFHVVVASGDLLKVNAISHPDLFYALRGGGPGSWGVVVSTTFRTFPTFNATSSLILLAISNSTVAGSVATLHAQHIFDWDSVRASQYFWLVRNSTAPNSFVLSLNSFMPNTTTSQSIALLAPFLNASLALPGVSLVTQEFTYGDINAALDQSDDRVGLNVVLGSRFIPAKTYHNSPTKVGEVYRKLLDDGTEEILGNLIAGGKVAENSEISSAVHPGWRTAKTHLLLTSSWPDSASLNEIRELRNNFQTNQFPILEEIAGRNAGSYLNEADVLEPNFQTTFFGPNYAKLNAIKREYDPEDLFIVGAGVGSERWDEWGICKI